MKSFSDPEVILFIHVTFIPGLLPGSEKDFDHPDSQSGSLERCLYQPQNGWR